MQVDQIFRNITNEIKNVKMTDSKQVKNDIPGFSEYLKKALNETSQLENNQYKLENDFIEGKLENIHQLTIATQKAEIAIQTVVEVRNKVMDAYREIMRMQV